MCAVHRIHAIQISNGSEWNVVFHNFYRNRYRPMMIELTFDRCENPKKVTCHFHNFHLRKGTFGSCFWNGSAENLEILFFGYLTKKGNIRSSGFVAVMFSVGEMPRKSSKFTPSQKQCFLGPRAVSLAQNWIAKNKTHLSVSSLVRYPKNFFSQVLVEPFCIVVVRGPFSRIKMMEESTWLVSNFARAKS